MNETTIITEGEFHTIDMITGEKYVQEVSTGSAAIKITRGSKDDNKIKKIVAYLSETPEDLVINRYPEEDN